MDKNVLAKTILRMAKVLLAGEKPQEKQASKKRAFNLVRDPKKIKKFAKELGFSLNSDGTVTFYAFSPLGYITDKVSQTVRNMDKAVKQCKHIIETMEKDEKKYKELLETVTHAWMNFVGKKSGDTEKYLSEVLKYVNKRVRRKDKKELNQLLTDFVEAIQDNDEREAQSLKKNIENNAEQAKEFSRKQQDAWEERRRKLMAANNLLRKTSPDQEIDIFELLDALK